MAPSKDLVVEMGFIEKAPAWKLRSKYFPCKVGGVPAWLALKGLPPPDCLTCCRCTKPLIFLCQLYAPVHHRQECFHRTVFVFVCRDPECCQDNCADNIRVFRSQLPRENEFYSPDPSIEVEEGSQSPGAADFNSLCWVCGCLGPKTCGGCKVAKYCSREHQALHWKAGHKAKCKTAGEAGTPGTAAGTEKWLFPEYEVELEPEEVEAAQEKGEEEVMREYQDLLRSGRVSSLQDDQDADTENDLVNMATQETDKAFQRFRTRIKNYPDQVVRYDRGQEPLWVASSHQPTSVPPCPHCGQPRQFEFQVMPQLLVHLKVDSPGRSLDWGTILVYSCQDSCQQEGQHYTEEVVYKQDYTPVTPAMMNQA